VTNTFENIFRREGVNTGTILRRVPDYVNYICPQLVHTHVNFQRVLMVDTSNPFISREWCRVARWSWPCNSSSPRLSGA
jgi:phosphoribulokinase